MSFCNIEADGLDVLGSLLAKRHVVQLNGVACDYKEVEIVSEYKAKGKDLLGFLKV